MTEIFHYVALTDTHNAQLTLLKIYIFLYY